MPPCAQTSTDDFLRVTFPLRPTIPHEAATTHIRRGSFASLRMTDSFLLSGAARGCCRSMPALPHDSRPECPIAARAGAEQLVHRQSFDAGPAREKRLAVGLCGSREGAAALAIRVQR